MRKLRVLAAVVAVAAVAVPTAISSGTSSAEATKPPATTATMAPPPDLPRPGGGPVAIHTVFSYLGDSTWLLNARTGRYQQLPYGQILLSPDLETVAVERNEDGQMGLARREALLRDPAAVRWTTLPAGSIGGWSPDGRALLSTTLDKDTWTFVVHRYDVATGRLTSTPTTAVACEVCTAGWAADSRRYVIRQGDGQARYLNPDGTAGPLVGVSGHIWDRRAYSPSRRYVIVEPVRPVEDAANPQIFDLLTRTVVSTVDTRDALLGWYDERHVVRILDGGLDVVDIRTGRVTKRIPGGDVAFGGHALGLGSSAGLRGPAAKWGF